MYSLKATVGDCRSAHDVDDSSVTGKRIPVKCVEQNLRDRLEEVLGLLL